jgi:hypothetical protein
MNQDLFPELGPKRRYGCFEDCLAVVRAYHPTVHAEGSCGPERTFWVGRRVVGHCWVVKNRHEAMWLRLDVRPTG